MKKYLPIGIGIAFVGILVVCVMIFRDNSSTISVTDAERTLQEFLSGADQWDDDYVLEPTNPPEGKIDNSEVYRFELRYRDKVEEVGNRLINNYAITVDGKNIFLYDAANDSWITQK